MATYNSDGSSSDVQAKMNLATGAGDIVTLPAGTFTWSSGVSWSAPSNAILQGAGTSATGGGDQTVIIDNITTNTPLIDITVGATGNFRFTGITVQSLGTRGWWLPGTTYAINDYVDFGGVYKSLQNSNTGNQPNSSPTFWQFYQTIKDSGTVIFRGPGQVRIDHSHFIPSTDVNEKIVIIYFGLFGVMDHCILDLTGINAVYLLNGRRSGGDNGTNYEWTLATDFGGSDFFYIEDCVINGYLTLAETTYGTRIFDGWTSAKGVVRFCTVSQACLSEEHGTGHSFDDRGVRAIEIYGNSCTSALAAFPNFDAVNIANGTAMAWGNSWDNVYKQLFFFKYWRLNDDGGHAQPPNPTSWGYPESPVATGTVNTSGTAVTKASGDNFSTSWPTGSLAWIIINGTSYSIASVGSTTSLTLNTSAGTQTGVSYSMGSNWDGNTDNLGYPAIDQPGRGQCGDMLDGDFPTKTNHRTGTIAWPNQALEPIYTWNNTGAPVPGYSGPYVDNTGGRVLADRDYYAQASGIQTNATTPFNGTTGCGWGTLANRPTTCTKGVGYFATDQGSWNTSASNPYGVQQSGASGILYVATATNTWTAYYTPYTYPHPLNTPSGAAPAPVTRKGIGRRRH